MSIEVEIVEVSPGVEVVEIDNDDLATVSLIGGGAGGGSGVARLDDLLDVEDTDAGSPGSVLTKSGSGQWVPASLAGGGGLQAYYHVQDEASTVWLIGHGLGFAPSGIEVRDNVGDSHYPVASWLDDFTVRLDFNDSVRGTARLS